MNTLSRPILQHILIDSMKTFCAGYRLYDPATGSAVDSLLLYIAKDENACRGDMLSLDSKDVLSLNVDEWNARCRCFDRDFIFRVSLFARDHSKEWSYLYGTSLPAEELHQSWIEIFNVYV